MLLFQHAAAQELRDCSDEDLLVLYHWTSDDKFFAELFSRYVQLTFCTCFKYLNDFEESRDQAMNIFHKLLEKCRQQTLNLNNFKQWLYVFIRNECRSYQKHQLQQEKEKGQLSRFVYQDGAFDIIIIRAWGHSGKFAPTRQQVRLALKKLPDPQQQCLHCFFYRKMSYKAIARHLGMNLKEVKSHLQNGKRMIKKILLIQYEEESRSIETRVIPEFWGDSR